ncbi:MAG: ATP-binding protein [Clostridia bacterium]|nr:ATP-binding protein [Clostridia bacterium]
MNKIKKMAVTLLSKDNDISLQLFNVMFSILTVLVTIATIVSCFLDFNLMTLTTLLITLIATSLALYLANKKKKMQVAGIIVALTYNVVLLPLLFLTTGGRPSGMVIWAIVAFLFCFLVVDGLACYLIALLGIFIYIGCICLEFYGLYPVYNIPTEGGQIIDLLVATVTVTFLFGMIFKYQRYAYNKQKLQIEQRDRKIKEAMAELELSNRNLEKASKAKSDFLANMSHEIRTPINAVLGLNELIARESKQDSILEYAANIKTAGDTLLSLINDILDYSKIESGKMELVQSNYETASQINSIITMILLKANDKGLKFITDIDPNFPIKLYGDELKIKQVITNLLNNSIKYTNVGAVKLEIKVDEFKDNKILYTVTVSDSGIGIKEEDKVKLFESFTRLDEQRNKNIEGTGLGITISQNLLHLMGSKLMVESEYGKGSKFSFRLAQKVIDKTPIGDINDALKKHVDTKVTTTYIAPHAKALMVDDVELNIKVAVGLLKPIGMQIDKALSGQEAIDKCKKEKYDIIFMDHMMPGMDGIEAAHIIRKISNFYERVPIIALTANAVVGAKEMFIESGMQDFVSKPINTESIIKVIEKWLPKNLIEYLGRSNMSNQESGSDLQIPSIEGINIDTAFKILGSKELVLDTLINFHDSIDERSKMIEDYERDNDIENYTIQVHALKSLARTIGADELAELSLYLEQCGKELNIPEIKTKTASLLEMYRGFKKKLDIICANPVAKVKVSDEAILAMIKDLKLSIEDYDLTRAEKIINDLAELDLGVHKEKFEELQKCINAIDFEGAKNCIFAMMKVLK